MAFSVKNRLGAACGILGAVALMSTATIVMSAASSSATQALTVTQGAAPSAYVGVPVTLTNTVTTAGTVSSATVVQDIIPSGSHLALSQFTAADNGSVTFTPDVLGSYRVELQFTDSNGAQNVVWDTVMVLPASSNPNANNTPGGRQCDGSSSSSSSGGSINLSFSGLTVTAGCIPATSVGQTFSMTNTVTGGAAVTNAVVGTFTPPKGSTLTKANVSVNNSGLVSFTPDVAGTYTLTVSYIDVQANSGFVTLTIPVTAAGTAGPTSSPSANPTASASAPSTASPTASPAPSPTASPSASPAPSHTASITPMPTASSSQPGYALCGSNQTVRLILKSTDGNAHFHNGVVAQTKSQFMCTQYTLTLTDGQLQISNGMGASSGLWGAASPTPGAYMSIQSDGNVVIYSSDGRVLASSGTRVGDQVGNYVALQGDGNFVVYPGNDSSGSGKLILSGSGD